MDHDAFVSFKMYTLGVVQLVPSALAYVYLSKQLPSREDEIDELIDDPYSEQDCSLRLELALEVLTKVQLYFWYLIVTMALGSLASFIHQLIQ